MGREGGGRIVLLSGASSAGKSTIARRFQALAPVPFWHYSIDHLRDAGVLPMERIRSGEFAWPAMREAFFAGFHRSLPAIAGAGNDLMVEHIVETPDWMDTLTELLAGLDVFFVAVHCPLDELERREAARGDRPVGDARRDAATIHRHAFYDLELDGSDDADRSARKLLDAWQARRAPGAFERMRASRDR